MVRGNWQRRVEQTEARKAVSRQRRQKKDNRATFKSMVANLVTQMDKHKVSSGTIHVWTDTVPSDFLNGGLYHPNEWIHEYINQTKNCLLEDETEWEDSARVKRRGRSTSFGETRRDRSGSFQEMQARGRSASFNEYGSPPPKGSYNNNNNSTNMNSNNYSKLRYSLDGPGSNGKKVHPRSRETEPLEEDANSFISLCRTQFFTGKCDSLKLGCKKGNFCRHVHYTKHHKTLGEILSLDQKEVLETAESSMMNAMLDDDDDQPGGMDMMYYFAIPMDQQTATNPKMDVQNLLCGQILSQALSGKSCANASLVYVAYENELIFDRYQTGVLVSELGLVFGEGKRGRSTSAISDVSAAVSDDSDPDNHDVVDAKHIPGAVLEYVLTFLPDTAVASMTQVCTAWHCEIGKTSSYLWRHLLDRRKWPCPLIETRCDNSESFFKLHYQVVREIHAVKAALRTLLNPRRGGVLSEEVEMVYQSFSARRTAPALSNSCVAIRVWSPTVVLAAYSHDCTLRLFQTVEKGPTGGRACRELISVCVDPYRKRSRLKARLVAMSIDGDTIACLLHVLGATLYGSYVLSTISREEYLEAAGGWSELEDGILNVTDVGEAIVNYLLSTDETNHQMLPLTNFLSNGGRTVEVEVLVSHSLVACGDGKILMEVSISVPDLEAEFNEDDDDDHDEISPMVLLARKLVVFSSKLGAIVWMGDSNPNHGMIPRRHDLLLSGVCHNNHGLGCSVVAVSSPSPKILLFEIDAFGQMSDLRYVEAAETVRAEMISSSFSMDNNDGGGWELDTSRVRSVALCPHDVVTVDVFYRNRHNFMEFKSFISFFPRVLNNDDDNAIPYQVEVFENCNVLSMERFRDEHILLVCEELELKNLGSGRSNANTIPEDDDDDDLDHEVDEGNVDNRSEHDYGNVIFISDSGDTVINVRILHVPTRHLIDCIRLPIDPNRCDLVMACVDNTVGVGVWSKGIVMTGADVRAVGCRTIPSNGTKEDLTNNNKGSAKKKKQRIVSKKNTKGRSHRGKGMRS